ncbi:MAG: transposase, partial [Endozoicomonas sp.]|uniref:transposase n=1 Tax=Endozoicomonas sp. TaxID=1892382 RepID=UPI003D9ADC9F
AVIAKAKAEIERRADERYQQELAEHGEKVARREAIRESGKKPRGKDQVNLTAPDSRIMPTSGGSFEQAYNVQAAVDVESGLIVEKHITQATNDKQQVESALEELATREDELGKVEAILADTGFFSEGNVQRRQCVCCGYLWRYSLHSREAGCP